MGGQPAKYTPKPMGVEIVNNEMGLLLASTEGGCVCWDGHARRGEPMDHLRSRYARFADATDAARFCALHGLRITNQKEDTNNA